MVARELLWSISRSSSPPPRRRRVGSSIGGERRNDARRFDSLFRPIRPAHLLPADDAHFILHDLHLLSRRVGVSRVHVRRRCSVLNEGFDSREEGAGGEVDVSKDVEGETVVDENYREVDEVGEEFDEIYSGTGKEEK